VPGGPRGLQNRRRHASGGVGSIPILSAVSFSIGRKDAPLKSKFQLAAVADI
jgi:hypothetical protein